MALFKRNKQQKPDSPDPDSKPVEAIANEPKVGMFSKLKSGLSRTSSGFSQGLGNLFLGEKEMDDDLMDDIETQLLVADVGVEATQTIIILRFSYSYCHQMLTHNLEPSNNMIHSITSFA